MVYLTPKLIFLNVTKLFLIVSLFSVIFFLDYTKDVHYNYIFFFFFLA